MSDQQPAPQAPAQQPAPQSNDEAIGQFAKGFLEKIDKDQPTDQLDPNEPVEAPEQPEAPETQEPEEAETPDPEVPEIPTFEVELEDGEKVAIPEKLKGRFMADKDYRQKTMALAEQRKTLETLTAKAQEISVQAQQVAPYYAQYLQLDNRVQQITQALTNPSPDLQNDPLTYNRMQGELGILLHHRDQLASGLQQQTRALSEQQTRLRAEQLKLDVPKLFEQFPEIQKPEVQQRLAKYAVEEGLPQEAMEYLNYSAAGMKLVLKANLYDQMVRDQATAQAKLKEKAKTLPAATQSSRAADKGAKDKQLLGEWQKGGGKMNDPAFTQLLRNKLKG